MIFEYDKEKISTQDELKISLADLRDLIQAYQIKVPEQALNEYAVIVEGILRKNRLPRNTIVVNGSSKEDK